MTLEAQVCPQCGSAIHFEMGQTEIVCNFCGTTVVKASAPPAAALEKELAEEQLFQEIAARNKRLYRAGQPATAKIITVETTNIRRNTVFGKGMLMSFTVEVLPKDEVPFTVETNAIVGLLAMDKYQPGTVLDVRYDPQDHTQLSVYGRHDVPGSNPLAEIQKAEKKLPGSL